MSLSIFDESSVESIAKVIDDSNSPGPQMYLPSDRCQRRVDALLVTNNDTIDHIVRLRYNDGTVNAWIGSHTIPAGTGFAGVPAIDLVPILAPVGTAGWVFADFTFMDVGTEEAVNAGKGVWFTSFGGIL